MLPVGMWDRMAARKRREWHVNFILQQEPWFSPPDWRVRLWKGKLIVRPETGVDRDIYTTHECCSPT
jgi:hypothetical protein